MSATPPRLRLLERHYESEILGTNKGAVGRVERIWGRITECVMYDNLTFEFGPLCTKKRKKRGGYDTPYFRQWKLQRPPPALEEIGHVSLVEGSLKGWEGVSDTDKVRQ